MLPASHIIHMFFLVFCMENFVNFLILKGFGPQDISGEICQHWLCSYSPLDESPARDLTRFTEGGILKVTRIYISECIRKSWF